MNGIHEVTGSIPVWSTISKPLKTKQLSRSVQLSRTARLRDGSDDLRRRQGGTRQENRR